jgi:hypothetical protein
LSSIADVSQGVAMSKAIGPLPSRHHNPPKMMPITAAAPPMPISQRRSHGRRKTRRRRSQSAAGIDRAAPVLCAALRRARAAKAAFTLPKAAKRCFIAIP